MNDIVLTEQDKQQIIGLLQAGKPLPAKYRPLLFEDNQQTSTAAEVAGADLVRASADASLNQSSGASFGYIALSPFAISIYRLDQDNRLVLTHVNTAAERMLGLGADAVLGKSLEEAFPNLVGTHIPDLFRGVARGELDAQTYEYCYNDERLSGYCEVSLFRVGQNAVASEVLDITERKKTEALLERERSLLVASLDSPPGIIILAIDLEYNYLFFNEAHHAVMLGVYQSDVEVGMNLLDCMSVVEDIESAKCGFGRALGGESNSQIDEYGDAQERSTYETFYGPIRDANGQIIGATAVAKDITEQEKIKDDLKVHRTLLQTLLDTTSDCLWEVDANAVYVDASGKGMALLGYEPEEIVGKTPFEFMSADEAKRVAAEFAAITKAKRPFRGLVNENLRKDGQRVILDTSGVPILDANGELTGYRGMDRDITERKQAEKQLAESENRYRDLVETSMDLIWECDGEGRFSYLNPAWESVTGRKLSDMLGHSFTEFLQPDEVEDNVAEFQSHMAGGFVKGFEGHQLHKNGSILTLVFNAIPLLDGNNVIIGTRGTAFDMTGRVLAEKREEELHDRLARAERLESLGTLAGGVAHDLNNVLGPMVVLPDLIAEDIADGGERCAEDIAESLSVIKTSALRAARIVSDLVSLGRRGNYNLVPLDINQHQCIVGVGAEVESIKAANPNVSIVHNFAQESLIVSGDESHLSRAICNVLQNAAESIEQEGKVTVSTFKKNIDEPLDSYTTIPKGRYAVIEISDTGEGIDKEILTRIFEPFVTRKKNTDRSGSGLGLSVVHGIMKDHAGFIDVHSTVGKGSVFALYLPLVDQSIAEPSTSEVASVTGGAERVLIVDDEPGQRYIACKSLTRFGYETAEAEDGRQALAHFEKAKEAGTGSPYDLVVLDMIMEDDFDGLKTYEAIQDLFPEQKVVICSGHAEGHRAKAAQELGADWLSKPYGIHDLARAVKGRLDRG